MIKHSREVAQQIKADKEKQLEPIHRRTAARQRAAQEEIVQASQLHSIHSHRHDITHPFRTASDHAIAE